MTRTIEIPLWTLLLLAGFAAVTFASHFVFPSVRWLLRRRAELLVDRLNARLARPIQPFKLARRTDMVMRLVHDLEVARAIAEHAGSEGVPEEVAFERARDYAREIVPSFSAIVYFGVAARMARWLSRRLYRVRVVGRERALEGVDPDATVVFVMNHRSNMDYVLVTWLASTETSLAYAVGEWARRWPLRPLIRAMGGYFVRRRDLNPLYRKVLQRYVQMAARAGVTQAVFPEGRLSRDGALQPPKLGLLSYLVAGHDPAGRDMVFVPVALAYDRVLEDRALVAEGTDRNASPFRLRWWQVARYFARNLQARLTGRWNRLGLAAVAPGRPLSLNAFLGSPHADPAEALGAELMARVAEVMPTLPTPAVAQALLDGARSRAAVEAALLRRRDALETILPPEADVGATAGEVLGSLQARRLVRLTGDAVEPTPEGTPLLRFYARALPQTNHADARPERRATP